MGSVVVAVHPDGTLALALSGLRTESEANARGHWSGKAKRAADQRAVVAAVVRARVKPTLPVEVTLKRYAPSVGLDDDNLRASMKAVRDGVTDALGLPDDRDPRVTWRYQQVRGPWGVTLLFRSWDPTRPGARVVEEPEGTRVEMVLTSADLGALAGALAAVQEGRGAGVDLTVQGVRLVLRAGGGS